MNREDARTQRDTQRVVISEETNRVATAIVDAAFAVHTTLGPGLLESVYEGCLEYELEKRGLKVERQVEQCYLYKGGQVGVGLRLDMVVNGCVVVELKAAQELLPVHHAQLLTYLKLSGHHLGLLINFNVALIKHGIRRLVR